MKIHSFTKLLCLAMLLALSSPAFASHPAATVSSPEAKAAQLNDRLKAIHTLDKSRLSREEKKALRTEVRQIKKEMAAISGGVYLSVGAILLIALLLILLL